MAAASSPQLKPGQQLAFVSCPLVRDTATLPCWLAEYKGELYYLGSQGSTSSAFYPPELLHEALVEATVGEGPRACGGVPLVSVEVSVRPELNRSCNTMLPAEPQFSAPPSPPAPIPRLADTTREFVIPYDFDSDFLTLHTTRVVAEAARIAALAKPTLVEIHAGRGATRLTDGGVLVERDGLSRLRAEKMAVTLVGLGVPKASVRATWQQNADTPDGTNDVARRQLRIRFK